MMVRLFGHEDESTDEYATEWREMVSQMRRNREEFEKYRESDPIHFWYHFLTKGTVPEKIADMVRQVLSIPIGSADCERAFSILFHIRSKCRSTLAPDTIQNLMRIRLNGPKDIQKFPALEYAKVWIGQNNMLTYFRGRIVEQPDHDMYDEEEDEKKALLDRSNLF